MDFPIDEKTKKKYIPDNYEGTIEDRFKDLPKESDLKGKKEPEPESTLEPISEPVKKGKKKK